jgi:hypothetical protein
MSRQITQRRCREVIHSWIVDDEAGHPEEELRSEPDLG